MTSGSLRNSGSVRLSLSLSLVLRTLLADCAACSDRAPPPKKAIVTINHRDAHREPLKANQRKRRPHARLCGFVGYLRTQKRSYQASS